VRKLRTKFDDLEKAKEYYNLKGLFLEGYHIEPIFCFEFARPVDYAYKVRYEIRKDETGAGVRPRNSIEDEAI
jgi:hypothetical protein